MKYENLAEMFAKQCEKMGGKIIYAFYDRRLITRKVMSASELYEASNATKIKIARSLSLHNSEVENRVVFLVFNSVSAFVIAFWAVVIAGGIPAPISRKMSAKDEWLKKALSRSRAVLILTDVETLVTSTDVPKLYVSGSGSCQKKEVKLVTSRRVNNDYALLQYSSGSTSEPKPVMLTHGNVLHNLDRIAHNFGISDKDIGASWLPHYHDMGLIGHVMVPLYCGITNHFISPLCFSANPITWLQLITLTKATISGAPNFAYQHCAKVVHTGNKEKVRLDLSSWRVAYCGSECILPESLQKFAIGLSAAGFSSQNWYPCYGLAESTLMVSSRKGVHMSKLDSADARKYVSVGKVQASEVIIKRDDGSQCQDQEVGEIHINSPSVALAQSQGWFNTGDVGFLLESELYIVGREMNMTKYHGEKVYLEEIESLLDNALEGVGIKRSLFMVVSHVKYPYVLLAESASKFSFPEVNVIRQTASPIISRFLGDSNYVIQCVERGKLPLTSSGKPDRKATAHLIKKAIHH